MGDRGYDQKIFQDKKLIDEFVCLFCLGVLKNPVITPKGCEFCESCILECITSHNNVAFNCPACQNENIEQSKLNESRRTRQTIDSLNTHCLNFSDKTNPCHWKGPRSAFETHMNICPVELVPCNCRTDGCEGKVFRRDLETHQKIAVLTSKKQISSTPDIHGFKIVQLPKSRSVEPNGVYCGEWKDGKKHGLGLLKYSESDWYHGEWRNDKMHGFGVLQSNIDKHAGWFMNGLKHGQGTVTYLNGMVVSNVWVDGESSAKDVRLSAAKAVRKKTSAVSNNLPNKTEVGDLWWMDDDAAQAYLDGDVSEEDIVRTYRSAYVNSAAIGASATSVTNNTCKSSNKNTSSGISGVSARGSMKSKPANLNRMYGPAQRKVPLIEVLNVENSGDDNNHLWSRLNAKSSNSNNNSNSTEMNNTSTNVTNVNNSKSSSSGIRSNNINKFPTNITKAAAATEENDFYSNRVSAAQNAKNSKSAATAEIIPSKRTSSLFGAESDKSSNQIKSTKSLISEYVNFFDVDREFSGNSNNTNRSNSGGSGHTSSRLLAEPTVLKRKREEQSTPDEYLNLWEMLPNTKKPSAAAAATEIVDKSHSNSINNNNSNIISNSSSIVGHSANSSAFVEPTPRKLKSRLSSEENREYIPFGPQLSKSSKVVNSSSNSSIGGNNSSHSPLSSLIQSNLLALERSSGNNNSNSNKTSASNINTNNNISTSVSATTTSNIVYSTNNTNNTNTNNSRVNTTAWNTNNAPFPSHTANVLRSLHTSIMMSDVVPNSVSSSSGSTQQRSTRSQVKKNDL